MLRIHPPQWSIAQWLGSLALALGASLVVLVGYSHLQPPIVAGEGYGWDGRVYAAMFEGMRAHAHYAAEFPFCKRIGVPWVAAQLGLEGFRFLNLFSGLVAVVAVFGLAARRAGLIRAAAVATPLLFYVFAPLRFTYFYPWTVDPPLMALFALAALAFDLRRVWLGLLCLLIAIPFKETALYFAVVAACVFVSADADRSGRARVLGTALVVVIALAAAALYRVLDPACSGSALQTIFGYARQLLVDPWRVLTVGAAAMLTLGAFLYRFEFADLKEAWSDRALLFATIALLIALAMAALGGSDSTRLLYVCLPLYAAVLAHLARYRSFLELVVLGLAGLVVNRWLATIPEPATYVPDITRIDGYFSYFPDVAGPVIAVAILVYYLCIYTVLGRVSRLWP